MPTPTPTPLSPRLLTFIRHTLASSAHESVSPSIHSLALALALRSSHLSSIALGILLAVLLALLPLLCSHTRPRRLDLLEALERRQEGRVPDRSKQRLTPAAADWPRRAPVTTTRTARLVDGAGIPGGLRARASPTGPR